MNWTDFIIEGIKLVGGLAGLIALGFKLIEELRGYLKIKVLVKNNTSNFCIGTEIENTSRMCKKKITNAFIIISEENLNIIEAGIRIARQLNLNKDIRTTNDFENLKADQPIYINQEIAFIPLDFYFSENIRFGDEKLTYSCSIDKTQLKSRNYSVRFYIYGENRLHRSTQDLLPLL